MDIYKVTKKTLIDFRIKTYYFLLITFDKYRGFFFIKNYTFA